VYDRWAAGTIDFSDERISEAFQLFDELVLTRGHTLGGAQRILSTPVADAGLPLFDPEPGCAMYKQATFATGWFPAEVVVGDDVDFFVLPGVDDEPAPLLTGGAGAVQFDDRPEVNRFMEYLMTPEGSAVWAGRGGYLSTRDSVDADYYAESEQVFLDLVLTDRETRFDASDTFPSSFRDQYLEGLAEFIADTSYLGNLADLASFLEELDVLRSMVDD
jgi:alpha-glucoside transport system substrate-binding protein